MRVAESGMPAKRSIGRRLSRRTMVRMGLAVAALPILAACGAQPPAPAQSTAAPALAERFRGLHHPEADGRRPDEGPPDRASRSAVAYLLGSWIGRGTPAGQVKLSA